VTADEAKASRLSAHLVFSQNRSGLARSIGEIAYYQ